MKSLQSILRPENDRFFYFNYDKIVLKPLTSRIFITFRSHIEVSSLAATLNSIVSNRSILDLQKTLSGINDDLKVKHIFVHLNNVEDITEKDGLFNQENREIASVSEVFEDREGKNLLALTNQLYLKIKDNHDIAEINDLLRKNGVVKMEFILDGLYHLTLNDWNEIDALDLSNYLSELEIVEYSNPDFFRSISLNYIPSDPLYPNQWYIPQINANWAWGSYTGSSANIGIMDIGIDISHPDLAGQFYATYDPTGRPLGADTHGTLCAGTAAAAGNSIGGIGVAFGAKLCQLRIGYNPTTNPDNPTFYSLDSWVVNGFSFARANGVNVVSCSFGLGSPTGAVESSINSYITSTTGPGSVYGGVVVAATGNSAAESIDYPASSELVFAIGASDHSKERAAFSNYGDKLLCIAPGVDITTTSPGGFYTSSFSGTSASTPIIAAVVAMIVESNYTLTRNDIHSMFVLGCDFIESIHGTPTGYGPRNKFVGYGIINLKNVF